MIKRILSLITLYIVAALICPRASLAQNFSTQLTSTYDVQDDAQTKVTHEFVITNSISTEYVTTYAFELAGNQIKDISVTSNGKKLDAKLTKARNKTNIAFVFPDKVVGAGQQRKFQVTYVSQDIATKIGKTVEVSIPRLSDTSLFSTYSVNLRVPSTFGTPVSTQPKIFTTSTQDAKTTLRFENLGDQTGISASFGKEQIAKLAVTYHLHNPASTKGIMEVALPADGMFQRIYYQSITPSPQTLKRDPDGNWIAAFELESDQTLTIQADFYAVTQSAPQENAEMLARKPDNAYLSAQEFWQINDANITKIARDLHSAEDIYSYVIRTLHYDYAKPSSETGRLGAIGALANPNSSVCTEFTDLFIALARKKGIPARAIIGYAYSQNTDLRPLGFSNDLLHTWPEYWDETIGTWIPVDPTWGQTTGGMDYFHHMDFNRIAFVTHGRSSTTPFSAGMYKTPGQESKDIATEFVDTLPSYTDTFTTAFHIRPRTLLGLTDTYTISVKNTSLHAAYAVPVIIRTQNKDGTAQVENKISLIPYEEREIPVQLPRKGLFTQGTSVITVQIGGQTFTNELTLKNTIRQYFPLIIIAILVATCIGICVLITRRLLVPRWQR